jgi:polyribonucleotide nucleotidyltransferase
MEDLEEIILLKRRLKKVMKLAEKLKKENYLEYEVNKELARRNDVLQKDLYETEERMKKAKLTIDRLENQFEQINDFTGILFSVHKTQQLLHFFLLLIKRILLFV